MLRLLARGPGGLVEQVVVPARIDENMSLSFRDSKGREVLLTSAGEALVQHRRLQSVRVFIVLIFMKIEALLLPLGGKQTLSLR